MSNERMNRYKRLLSGRVFLRPVILFFAMWLSLPGMASDELQPFLLLEKPGTKKRIRFYVGDEILFKRYDQDYFNSKVIVGLSDTSFFVDKGTEVRLRDVEAMADRSRVKAVRQVGRGALLAIPAMFLFSIANNAFNTGETPLVGREVYNVAIPFAALGGASQLYKGRRYRLKNRWRLIVVHH